MPNVRLLKKKGYPVSSKVRLKSFNGTRVGPADCRAGENYWLLIGQSGEVVEPKNEHGRLLVKFDLPVRSLGLHCHNPIENSLYILESDVEPVE